jgi:Domain of unknown function (DUF4037)
MLPAELQNVIDDMLPTIRALAEGRYAVSIGGSIGRGQFDRYSDIDFRLFCDVIPPDSPEHARLKTQMDDRVKHWDDQGIRIDGCWIRSMGDISAALDQWCQGVIAPVDLVWTIWGYHLPSDIVHQYIIEDPYSIIAGWQAQLRPYPPLLKKALLEKHLRSLRYWRNDYHYHHKVQRQDRVFLAGIASKLVHDLIQILFALNETYYVGDGNNLKYISAFAYVPDGFGATVDTLLYPQPTENTLEQQYDLLMHLIDNVEVLITGLV